jgi:hypothetical protein
MSGRPSHHAQQGLVHGSALVGAAQGITTSAGVGVFPDQSVFGQYDRTSRDHGWVGATIALDRARPFQHRGGQRRPELPVVRFIRPVEPSYQRSDSNQALSNGLESGVVNGNLVSLSVTAFYPVRGDL